MRAETHIDFSFWCKSRCFECTTRQVRFGTHRDLLFRSKSCGFASKNHVWGQGPIETSNSDANHAVLHAQNDTWGLGSIDIRYSGPKLDGLLARTTDEGWNPERLVILMLGTLFCMQKITSEVWDPQTHAILVLRSPFWMRKTTDEGWDRQRLVILMLSTFLYMHKMTGHVWEI